MGNASTNLGEKRGRGNPAWVKGVSGNPTGGKKKEDCLVSCIKAELAKKTAKPGQTKEQLFAEVLVEKALTGDARSMELVLEYTAVKPDTSIRLKNPEGGPLEVLVRYDGNRNEVKSGNGN